MSSRSVWKLTEGAHIDGDRLLVIEGELDIATAPELVTMLERLRSHRHPVVPVASADRPFRLSPEVSALDITIDHADGSPETGERTIDAISTEEPAPNAGAV